MIVSYELVRESARRMVVVSVLLDVVRGIRVMISRRVVFIVLAVSVVVGVSAVFVMDVFVNGEFSEVGSRSVVRERFRLWVAVVCYVRRVSVASVLMRNVGEHTL